jgi:hypothetical protein
LSSPAAGSSFTAPASVPLAAAASDSDGSVTGVEFFSGSQSLGVDSSAPYELNWQSVPAGSYSLTARATDDDGAQTTSQPVAITVQAASSGQRSFYRAINFGGPALTLDGNPWAASASAANLRHNGSAFSNQTVTLAPTTDSTRASMIRSSIWNRALNVELTSVPAGDYEVFLYVWEDNASQTYDIALEGRIVTRHTSGAAGNWKRLGPYTATITDATITVTTSGGDANLSGLEVWRPASPQAATAAH